MMWSKTSTAASKGAVPEASEAQTSFRAASARVSEAPAAPAGWSQLPGVQVPLAVRPKDWMGRQKAAGVSRPATLTLASTHCSDGRPQAAG